MKCILAVVMTLAMLLGVMTVGASAKYMDDTNQITSENSAGNSSTAGVVANGTAGENVGSATVDVKIQTGKPGDTTHVYAVSYDVTELTFTYGSSAGLIWNPETLKYETKSNTGNDGWTTNEQKITVTNYSDLPVKVTPTVQKQTEEVDNVEIQVSSALELASAAPEQPTGTGTVQSGQITVTVSGDPIGYYETAGKIAKILLTVVNNETVEEP